MLAADEASPPATRRPAGPPALGTLRHLLLTLAIMLASIMQTLDMTIANVAVPHMQAGFGVNYESIAWVLTSYIVAAGIATPLTGWMSDRVGARPLFLWAVAGFVASSVLCGLSTSISQIVVWRVVQGVTGAFIGPLSQTVLLDINPPERHGKAMTAWGMGVMGAPIFGPVIGAILTEYYSWRWVFLINAPVGVVCLGLLAWLLPAKPLRPRSFDVFGFAMIAVAVSALQLMLDRGQQRDWLESTEIVIELSLAAAAAWLFVVHMTTAKVPLFPRPLLQNRSFVASVVLMGVTTMVMMTSLALMPSLLQDFYQLSIIDSGMLLAPRGAGIMATMLLTGRLLGRVDPRHLIVLGLGVMALGTWQMTSWTPEIDRSPILLSSLVQGLGMGFIFVPLNTIAFAAVPPPLRADAASMLNLIRNVGGSIGISVFVTIIGRQSQVNRAELAELVTPMSEWRLQGSLERLGRLQETAELGLLQAEIARQAAMIAYIDAFALLTWVALALLPLAVLLHRPQRPATR